jgi:hypothetical protein
MCVCVCVYTAYYTFVVVYLVSVETRLMCVCVCVFIYLCMYVCMYIILKNKCPAVFHVVTVETSIKGAKYQPRFRDSKFCLVSLAIWLLTLLVTSPAIRWRSMKLKLGSVTGTDILTVHTRLWYGVTSVYILIQQGDIYRITEFYRATMLLRHQNKEHF